MKVALVSQLFVENKGGAERFGVELSRFLIKKGLNIKLFARKVEPKDLKPWAQELNIPKKPPSFRILALAFWGLLAARRWKADRIFGLMPIFEADFYWLAGGVYRYWLKTLYPNFWKRAFFSILRPHYFLNCFLQERALFSSKLKKVITVSLLEKEILFKEFGLTSSKIEVIPNGVDTSRFNPKCRIFRTQIRKALGLNKNDYILVFVSNNFKRKGLATILRSLVRLKNPYLKLLVIGQDKKVSFLKMVHKLGLQEQVYFLGYVSRVEQIYGASDLLVFPSQYDSFGNVVLEAMACGLPVIVSKSTGASLVIKHGREGFILDSWQDDETLACYIEEVLSKKEEMGLEALKKARQFSQERCFEEYFRVLTSF